MHKRQTGRFSDRLEFLGLGAVLLAVWICVTEVLTFFAGGYLNGDTYNTGNLFLFWPLAAIGVSPFLLLDDTLAQIWNGANEQEPFRIGIFSWLSFCYFASPILLNVLHWGARWAEKPNLAHKFYMWRFEFFTWPWAILLFFGGLVLYVLIFGLRGWLATHPRTL